MTSLIGKDICLRRMARVTLERPGMRVSWARRLSRLERGKKAFDVQGCSSTGRRLPMRIKSLTVGSSGVERRIGRECPSTGETEWGVLPGQVLL